MAGSQSSETDIPAPGTANVRDIVDQAEVQSILRVRAGSEGLDRPITHPRIQKSGLVLVGHTRGIVPTRLQILGETEMTFLEKLDAPTRRERIEILFGLGLSGVVVTRGVEPFPELVDASQRTTTPLLLADPRSSTMINVLHGVLDRLIAPQETRHGVLVEIHGLGTLLQGPSGIGKSECALFLVERGHQLVADDQVVLKSSPSGEITGCSAPLLRHHLEVRGIGILNVRDLYGATAVHDLAAVELVVELVPWRDEEQYERLGLDDLRYELLGTQLPMLRVPVRPGRDMAVILEVAARNQLLKRSGHHAARKFAKHLADTLGTPDPTAGGG